MQQVWQKGQSLFRGVCIKAGTLRAHKDPPPSEGHVLLGETIFIPVVCEQSCRCRDFHAVALFSLLWLSCPLMMANFISLLIKRTSLQPVLPSDAGLELVSTGMKFRRIQTDPCTLDLGLFWLPLCLSSPSFFFCGLLCVSQRWVRAHIRHSQGFPFNPLVSNKVQWKHKQPFILRDDQDKCSSCLLLLESGSMSVSMNLTYKCM